MNIMNWQTSTKRVNEMEHWGKKHNGLVVMHRKLIDDYIKLIDDSNEISNVNAMPND